MSPKTAIQVKRVYDPAGPRDGRRFLVERLWPRGIKKDALAADAWMKEVAPSTRLRTWFGHRPERWEEFQRRYREELDAQPETWMPLIRAAEQGSITLLYSARDTLRNAAVALRDYLGKRRSGRARAGKPGRSRKVVPSRNR